jgi:hypothetical protein
MSKRSKSYSKRRRWVRRRRGPATTGVECDADGQKFGDLIDLYQGKKMHAKALKMLHE